MKRNLLLAHLLMLSSMLFSNYNSHDNNISEPCMQCFTAPLLFCPSVYFGCPGDDISPLNTGEALAFPGDMNCPSPVISYTDTLVVDSSCYQKYHRIWKAQYPDSLADPKLYTQCVQTLILEDDSAPNITFCPSDIVVDLSVLCDSTVFWNAPIIDDACGIDTIMSNYNPGDTFNSGTSIVEYLAIDNCGQIDSCQFSITVTGVCCENLILECPSDTMVCVNSSLDPVLTGTAFVTMPDSSCIMAHISYSDSIISPNPECVNGVIIERTWYASDSLITSIYDSCVQVITTFDSLAPQIINMPSDTLLITNDTSCSLQVQWTEPDALDDCGVFTFVSDIPNGSYFTEGSTSVHYLAVDNCGNTTLDSFNITIVCDTLCQHMPVLSCPTDITLCPMDSLPGPDITGLATVVPGDSTCIEPLLTYYDSITSSGPCSGSYVLSRIWIATDPENSDLSDSCAQSIVLEDWESPIIDNIPSDITVTSQADPCVVPVTWLLPSAHDNCGIASFESNIAPGSLFSQGTTTVVYTAMDACGLITTASFEVTIECLASCTAPPAITCPDDYWECPTGTIPGPNIAGQALAYPGSLDCTQPLLSYQDIIVSSGPCPTSKIIERQWLATDPEDNANSSSCIQVINLEDGQAPGILYCPSDITVNGWYNSGQCLAAVSWNDPLAIDNCGAPNLMSTDIWGDPINNGQNFEAGTTQVVYTAEDLCGNTTECAFSVTVSCANLCNTPPSIYCPNAIVSCPGSSTQPSATGWATAYSNSNCPSTDISYNDLVISTGPCYGQKLIERTWTASYLSQPSLQSTCTQTIQLKDDTAPSFDYCPNDITVYDSSTPVTWNAPQAWDNCGIANSLSNYNPGDYFPLGTTTVNYWAEDICWNAGSCSFNVTVINQYNIELNCPNDIFLNCNSGHGVIADWSTPTYNSICNNCENGNYIPGFVYMGSLNGSQYYCSTSPAQWQVAESTCNSLGGHLVSINSAEENAFLTDILTLQSAWIGLSDVANEGVFEWSNGQALSYSNWYPGQPNNYNNNQDYVELMNTGYWNDQYNHYNLEYIMELPCGSVQQLSGPAPGTWLDEGHYTVNYEVNDGCGGYGSCSFDIYVEGSLEMNCPSDIVIDVPQGAASVQVNWNEPYANTCCGQCSQTTGTDIQGFSYLGSLNAHRYYISNFNASWPNAKTACESNGGYLAIINDANENNYLAQLINHSAAWIGLSDSGQEGLFEWVDGSSVSYNNWYPGQPNNYSNNQDYVEFLNDGSWNDQYNYYTLPFILELPECIDIHQTSGPVNGAMLQAGTQHTVSYEATDACGNVDYCTFDITVNDNNTTPDYCKSQGINSLDYYIDHVRFGQLDNPSGNNGGYEDFSGLGCFNAGQGLSYELHLVPSIHQQDMIYWRVWIDTNLDGDFYDPNEMVAYGSSVTTLSGIVTLPNSIWAGDARMRIIMSPGSYPADPCGEYPLGETEDYCITVLGTSNITSQNNNSLNRNRWEYTATELNSPVPNSIQVYPNPVSDYLVVDGIESLVSPTVFIKNTEGKVVWKEQFTGQSQSRSIDLMSLPDGIYFVHINSVNHTEIKKIIVHH